MTDEASAVLALQKLNEMGVETAVVSSCSFGGGSADGTLACYASKAGFIFRQRTCKSLLIYGNPNWELSLRPVSL